MVILRGMVGGLLTVPHFFDAIFGFMYCGEESKTSTLPVSVSRQPTSFQDSIITLSTGLGNVNHSLIS
jgi:hypothetical protein